MGMFLHEVLVHYENESEEVCSRDFHNHNHHLGGGEASSSSSSSSSSSENRCVPSFDERLSIASSSFSGFNEEELESSMVLVTDYAQIFVFRGQDLERPLVSLRLNDEDDSDVNDHDEAKIGGGGKKMKSKKREDLFVAFAKWSKCTPTRHNNNTDGGEGYGQFFTSQVGANRMFVHTRVGRRVVKVDLREEMKANERFVGGFVLPTVTTTKTSGDKRNSFTLCAIVERSFYSSSGWMNVLSFGNSTKKKGRRRKHCQLEVRSIEFNDEEDVVVRSAHHQMKKTTLKNVEGMVFVKGFEVDEKTGTVAVVGAASEEDEGKETTMCVTMYSFRSTSENIGEFPVVASGKGSSSSPFSSAVESNSKRIVSSSRCDVSVESDASTATTRIGIRDGNTRSASVWETGFTGEDEFIDDNQYRPITRVDDEADKTFNGNKPTSSATLLSNNCSAFADDESGETTLRDNTNGTTLFQGTFAHVSGMCEITSSSSSSSSSSGNSSKRELKRICVLESFPENDQSWRLLTIDERTPEEMFTKYLDTKCWDEALELANVYRLDTNALYKKKWFALVDDLCKHNVSNNSKSVGISASAIIETLSSISDRKWVVAECLLRVAPTYETQKLLLSQVVAETDRFSNTSNIGTDDEETKWWLRARLAALGALDRLETLRAMHLGYFSSSAYESFRFVEYLDAAKAVARAGNARGLEVLLQRHNDWFRERDLLNIAGEIPECARVSEYKKVLLEILDRGDTSSGGQQNQLRTPDWCETSEILSSIVSEEYGMTLIVEQDDRFAKVIGLQSTVHRETDTEEENQTTNIGQWVIERAFQIDERSGSISNARDFLFCVASSSSSCFEDASVENALQSALALCAMVLLEEADDDIDALLQMRAHSVSLRDFHGKAPGDKLSLLLNEEDTTIDNVWSMLDIATRYLYVVDDDEGTPMMQTLLQKWLVSIAFDKPSQLTYLSRALQWFTKDGNKHAKAYLGGLNGIERVVTEITHSFSRVDKRSIEKLKSILSDLVLNDNDYDNDDISNANEEDLVVKRLLSFIDAAEVILYRKEMLEISLRELSESSANETFARELLVDILKEEHIRKLNDSGWLSLFKDLQTILLGAFPKVDYREDSGILLFALERLVRSQLRNHAWSAAKKHIHRSENHSIPILPTKEYALPLLLEVAKDLTRASLSINDQTIVNADTVLRLIPLDEETGSHYAEVLEELYLIDTLRKLGTFNVFIAPLEFENAKENRESILSSCLTGNAKRNYLRLDELIEVGNCLGIHALRVELMCAEYAFSAQRDMQASARMSLRLIANEYSECWRICAALGSSSDQLTVKTRLTLLSFAVSHCATSQVPGLLDEWQRAQVEEQQSLSPTPNTLYDLGLKGTEASDEMLVSFLRKEEPSMLKKIDELGKLSSKNRSQESDQQQFPKLPQLACAKSFAYLAMIEDPNIAGDAVDALAAKASSGRALRILLSLGFYSRAARALDDGSGDDTSVRNGASSFASASMSDLTNALQHSGTVDAKLAGKYRSRVHAMTDAETLAFLLGQENFDANTFVAADNSKDEYGYRAKAILELASSGVSDADLSRLPKSTSDDEEVSSVSSAPPQTVLKLCMRLADTYGVDPRDVYISRTETFFESNFENDETLLNAYAEALKTRTEEQKSSSFTDVLTRIAWPVVSSARRVDVLRSYLKIASYDDALVRLDMFEELVPSLDAFQIFQSDGAIHGKSSAIEISRLFANEVASKAHPDFPNALASALAKAFANSSISSESIFASAVTTVLREAATTATKKKRSTPESRWESACSALSFLDTDFLKSLLLTDGSENSFLTEASRALKITVYSDILYELENSTSSSADVAMKSFIEEANRSLKNLEFVHQVENALPRLHPDKLDALEANVDVCADTSVAALVDVVSSWMVLNNGEPFVSALVVAEIYASSTKRDEDYKSLSSTMCSNALEIALDENPFDANKLENMIIKSLGTNEGCNDEENASALNTVRRESIARLERFVGEAVNENDRTFVVNLLSGNEVPWISDIASEMLMLMSVDDTTTAAADAVTAPPVVVDEERNEQEETTVKTYTKEVNAAAQAPPPPPLPLPPPPPQQSASALAATATTPSVSRLFIIQSESCLKALAPMKKISESDLVDFTSAKAFIDDTLETVVDASNVNQLNAIRDVLFLWEDIAPWARLDENGTGENVVVESALSSMWFSLMKKSGNLSFAKECIALASTTKLKKKKKQLSDDSKFAILSESRAIELMKMKSSGDDDPLAEATKYALLLPYESVRKVSLNISVDSTIDRELALALISVKSAFGDVVVNASTTKDAKIFLVELLRRLQEFNPAALFYAVSVLANEFKRTTVAADALFSCLRVAEAFRNPDSAKIVLNTYLSQSNLKKFTANVKSDDLKNFTSTEACAFQRVLKDLRERQQR